VEQKIWQLFRRATPEKTVQVFVFSGFLRFAPRGTSHPCSHSLGIGGLPPIYHAPSRCVLTSCPRSRSSPACFHINAATGARAKLVSVDRQSNLSSYRPNDLTLKDQLQRDFIVQSDWPIYSYFHPPSHGENMLDRE
jgi:hypothetical protein